MNEQTEIPKFKHEIFVPQEVLTHAKTCLESLGFNEVDASRVTFEPVDHYHKNTVLLKIPSETGEQKLIMKVLDKKLAWDVSETGIVLEHDTGHFVGTLLPELPSRTVAGWFSKDDDMPTLVFYHYLGEAATYIEDPEMILTITNESMNLLSRLHLKTISGKFGKSLSENDRENEQYPEGIAAEIVRYLVNDIHRDNLDPEGNIINTIYERWIPILNEPRPFCLTHKDMTMSNIMQKDGHVYTFIDWTYSRWDDPANDLAYLAFWAINFGKGDETKQHLSELIPQYQSSGLEIDKTFPFFLAFKCIEYGRFKGSQWVEAGKKILSTSNSSEAIESLTHSMKNFI